MTKHYCDECGNEVEHFSSLKVQGWVKEHAVNAPMEDFVEISFSPYGKTVSRCRSCGIKYMENAFQKVFTESYAKLK